MKLRIWRPLTGDKRQILLLRRLHAVRVCHDPRQNASAFRFGYRGSGVIFENLLLVPGLHRPRLAATFGRSLLSPLSPLLFEFMHIAIISARMGKRKEIFWQ